MIYYLEETQWFRSLFSQILTRVTSINSMVHPCVGYSATEPDHIFKSQVQQAQAFYTKFYFYWLYIGWLLCATLTLNHMEMNLYIWVQGFTVISWKGVAIVVTPVRSCWKLPPCLTVQECESKKQQQREYVMNWPRSPFSIPMYR